MHLHTKGPSNERLLRQCRVEKIDLQSMLNESRERTSDLLIKFEEDRHVWDVACLEGTLAEM